MNNESRLSPLRLVGLILCGIPFLVLAAFMSFLVAIPLFTVEARSVPQVSPQSLPTEAERHGNAVRIAGYVETPDVLELPEWGVCMHAMSIRCRMNRSDESVQRVDASHLMMEEAELPSLPWDAKWMAPVKAEEFNQWLPLPQELITRLPEGVIVERWQSSDQILTLHGTREGEPFCAEFSYMLPRSSRVVHLLGIPEGCALRHVQYYWDAAYWESQTYFPRPEPGEIASLLFSILPGSLIFFGFACAMICIWGQRRDVLSLLGRAFLCCTWVSLLGAGMWALSAVLIEPYCFAFSLWSLLPVLAGILIARYHYKL